MENNKELKYNYILYNMETADKWQIYKELLENPNIRMCKGALPANPKLAHKLHKLHWSAKLNRKISLPFKKLWFNAMTNGRFEDKTKPVCHVFFGGQYIIRDSRIADYIRKLNIENKIAIHYRDIIKNNEEHIDLLKEKSDLIYTYNKSECEQYGVEYFSSYVYSKIVPVTQPDEFDCDLYFVGYSKGRFDLLKNLCSHLSAQGVRCKFKIAGIPQQDRVQQEGIEYLDNPIPYTRVVNEVQRSRCVLELLQENSDGATMRSIEAIAYKRKLLTNGKDIANRMYYNKDQMMEFSDIESIDTDFLKSPIDYDKMMDVESFSPMREIEYLENYFSK